MNLHGRDIKVFAGNSNMHLAKNIAEFGDRIAKLRAFIKDSLVVFQG